METKKVREGAIDTGNVRDNNDYEVRIYFSKIKLIGHPLILRKGMIEQTLPI